MQSVHFSDSLFMNLFFATLFVFGYVVAPVALIWGWIRWRILPKVSTLTSILSLIGFVSASASGILAIAAILYAWSGATNVDSRLFGWFLFAGLILSLVGSLFAVGGIWRRHPLQWLAPAATVSMLAFWLLITSYID